MSANIVTVDTNKFIKAFESKWVHDFNNSSSLALKQCWSNLSNAFNTCITNNRKTLKSSKIVVPLPTGCGKTEGLIQYLQLLNKDTTALVVVPFIEDANYIEERINNTQEGKAIAVHSKNEATVENAIFSQILIVTHTHFLMNHDKQHINQDLIVIDEAIDVITEYSVDKMSLERLSIVCTRLYSKFNLLKDDRKDIKHFLKLFEELQLKGKELNISEKLLFDENITFFVEAKNKGRLDFNNLKDAIKQNNCSKILTGTSSLEIEQEIKEKLINTLDSIKHIIGEWQYFINIGKNPSINSASFIKFDKSVVILDATANTNKLYHLADDVDVYNNVEGARNYKNVNCYISKGHNTGKSNLVGDEESKAKCSADNLIKTISEIDTLGSKSKVLIVTHKALKSHLQGYDLGFTYDVTNWGAVTGKNDWDDYTDVIIFGLNHKPKQHAINRHSSVTNPQHAFRNTEERCSIKNTDLLSEIIQAINRVRCRKVIDDQGNCDKTNVFILLPNGVLCEQFEEEIQKQMININLLNWNYDYQRRKESVKRSRYLEPIITFVLSHESKIIRGSDVKHALGIPNRSFSEVVKSAVFKSELEKYNIKYELPATAKRGKMFYKI